MKELRRCLKDNSGNALSKLFHIELKDLIKKGLGIMGKMPQLDVQEAKLECHNSHVLLDIRNDMLSHVYDSRNQKIVETISNFAILLYDSDEAWRRIIYQAIVRVKEAEFKEEEAPRLEYWKEKILVGGQV